MVAVKFNAHLGGMIDLTDAQIYGLEFLAYTTVKRLRNVLRLVTTLTFWTPRDVTSVDPDGSKRVFRHCIGLKK